MERENKGEVKRKRVEEKLKRRGGVPRIRRWKENINKGEREGR